MMGFIRDRNAEAYAITSPDGIDEAKYVEIGGIEQWITLRGEDRNHPVLLFLHGGPGDATNPWGYAGFRSWLKHFTVVQWDQRGAGRTLERNGSSLAPTITIERMAQDGIELAELLRKSLAKEKIVLVGHSWSSILGVFVVKARNVFEHFVVEKGGESSRSFGVRLRQGFGGTGHTRGRCSFDDMRTGATARNGRRHNEVLRSHIAATRSRGNERPRCR